MTQSVDKRLFRDFAFIFLCMHPQLEMDEKWQKLETLQSKISELKKCSNIPETPAKLQVLKISDVGITP